MIHHPFREGSYKRICAPLPSNTNQSYQDKNFIENGRVGMEYVSPMLPQPPFPSMHSFAHRSDTALTCTDRPFPERASSVHLHNLITRTVHVKGEDGEYHLCIICIFPYRGCVQFWVNRTIRLLPFTRSFALKRLAKRCGCLRSQLIY